MTIPTPWEAFTTTFQLLTVLGAVATAIFIAVAIGVFVVGFTNSFFKEVGDRLEARKKERMQNGNR